jgi:hypothetical protein
MAPRLRVALVAITAVVLVPGALAGWAAPSDASLATVSVAGPDESPAALVAVPVKSPLSTAPRGLPQATVVATAVAAFRFSARRRSMRGLPFLLGDVGDRWRALLFGAPPSLL